MPEQTTRPDPEWRAPARPYLEVPHSPDGREVGTGDWKLMKLSEADDEVWGALLPAAHPMRPDGSFDTDVAGYGIHTTPAVWAVLKNLVARAAQRDGALATVDAMLDLVPRGEFVPEWAARHPDRPHASTFGEPYGSEGRARRVTHALGPGAQVGRRVVTDWEVVATVAPDGTLPEPGAPE